MITEKRLFSTFCALLLTLCLLAPTASARESVDWLNGKITVKGTGIAPPDAVNRTQARAMAQRAAVADGYRLLAEVINGVTVDSESTVEKMILTSDVIKTSVSAIIKGAVPESETYLPDDSCEVVLSVPMYGVSDSLASAVLTRPKEREPFPLPTPQSSYASNYSAGYPNRDVNVNINVNAQQNYTTRGQNNYPFNFPLIIPTAPARPTPPSFPAAPSREPTESSIDTVNRAEGGDYTGVVIDCTGLGLKPAMSPRIMNDAGLSIYGHKNLDYDLVTSKGMAAYSRSADVSQIPRAGDNPLVVKAVALEGHNVNPVVSVADANLILTENSRSHFLDNLNVVFVR